MITRLKLKPGQKGTKALLEKYGSALVCVRYRYGEASRTRIKTVELIEEKKELPARRKRIADEALVPVQIAYGKLELGKMARKLGGCQSALKIDPPSASKIDPPQVVVFSY